MKTCGVCGKVLYSTNKSGYCQEHRYTKENEEKIKHWLETGDTGCGLSTTLRNCIRDYIYQSQDSKCAICSIDREWNGKQLNFVLDHIDGNAANDWKENLRLVCPNCDSQLGTFKSRNKESARTYRRQ